MMYATPAMQTLQKIHTPPPYFLSFIQIYRYVDALLLFRIIWGHEAAFRLVNRLKTSTLSLRRWRSRSRLPLNKRISSNFFLRRSNTHWSRSRRNSIRLLSSEHSIKINLLILAGTVTALFTCQYNHCPKSASIVQRNLGHWGYIPVPSSHYQGNFHGCVYRVLKYLRCRSLEKSDRHRS